MAAKVYGNKSFVAFAEEVTWNTAVNPPTRFMEIIEAESLKFSRTKTFIPTGNTRSVRHQVNGKLSTDGGWKTFLTYNGDELLLLKHAMGSTTPSGPTDTTAYTHAFACTESLPVGLTMETNRNSAVYTKAIQHPGFMISKFTIEQPIEGVATIAFEGIGSGDENEVSATAASFPSIIIADWNHLASPGVLTLNGTEVPCDNITVSFENTMASDVYTMTSNQRADLKPDGERIVTLTFNTYIEASDPRYALFTGDTAIAAVLTWKGATVAGASTTKYTFTVSCPQCRITEFGGFNGGTGGPIKGQVTMRAYATSTLNDEIAITVINADATV